ncbi:unnamed protein product [Schistosoma mattheei]|uniref:TraB domain-containing protein n=1 Tax=Schistosoma mattheei TaxID=31246 RepID=A0AA85BZ23_9TREM|nr:unnamed protein product [Schistosoma mattheei]
MGTKSKEKTFELPETVNVIECENQCKVYLIGTAHFSEESIADVKKVMEHVHPDIVMLELCANRSHTLTMDEENIKSNLRTLILRPSFESTVSVQAFYTISCFD